MKKFKNLIAGMLVIVMAAVFTLPATSMEAEAASAPKKTKITYLKSTKPGKVTIKYAKVKGVKYQIQVATNSKMTKGRKAVNTGAVSKTLSLKKGVKYWVRVRTYKKIRKKTKYSKWSAKKAVLVKKAVAKKPATTPAKPATPPAQNPGNTNTHTHSYTIPITETEGGVMVQRPFSEAAYPWKKNWTNEEYAAGNKDVIYRCLCDECITYNVNYGSTSNVEYNKEVLLEHMNEVNSLGWREEVYDWRNICYGCGEDITDKEADHRCPDGKKDSWALRSVLVKTIEHKAIAEDPETVTVGYKCSCGAIKYN